MLQKCLYENRRINIDDVHLNLYTTNVFVRRPIFSFLFFLYLHRFILACCSYSDSSFISKTEVFFPLFAATFFHSGIQSTWWRQPSSKLLLPHLLLLNSLAMPSIRGNFGWKFKFETDIIKMFRINPLSYSTSLGSRKVLKKQHSERFSKSVMW